MTDELEKPHVLASMTDCGVCGRPLVYAADSVVRSCDLCGTKQTTMIFCPAGHFVCDTCHGAAAMDVVRRVLETTTSRDPVAILEQVMTHPALPMHGPEHHAIVPGVLVAAARNAGAPCPTGRSKPPSSGPPRCQAAGAATTAPVARPSESASP